MTASTNNNSIILIVPAAIFLFSVLPNDALLVQQIMNNRNGNIKVKAGFDGQYGEAVLQENQKKLF